MRLLLLGAALALAGCGGWYKPGAGEPEFYQARYQCNAQAMQMYPIAMTSSGGYQTPATTNCTTFGATTNCTTTPGVAMPGVQSDQNQLPRNLAFQDCMRAAGWSWRTQ